MSGDFLEMVWLGVLDRSRSINFVAPTIPGDGSAAAVAPTGSSRVPTVTQEPIEQRRKDFIKASGDHGEMK